MTKTVTRAARVDTINGENAALLNKVYSIIYACFPQRYHNVVSEDSLLYLWATTVAKLPGALHGDSATDHMRHELSLR